MRYTTVIDISEMPRIYANKKATMLYLHMALKSGYHDEDRDLCVMSLRQACAEIGLTLSAARHAFSVLQAAGLLQREGEAWRVKKFVLADGISPRPKSVKKQREIEAKAVEEAARDERKKREEEQRAKEKELRKQGKNSFILYYEEMMSQAEKGDPDAQEIVRRRRAMYEQELKKLKEGKEIK